MPVYGPAEREARGLGEGVLSAIALALHDRLDDLAKGAFQQATIEHELADYRAQIRATNMGNGYILTESYAAL